MDFIKLTANDKRPIWPRKDTIVLVEPYNIDQAIQRILERNTPTAVLEAAELEATRWALRNVKAFVHTPYGQYAVQESAEAVLEKLES